MFAELNIYHTRQQVECARSRARIISLQEQLPAQTGDANFTDCDITQNAGDVLNDNRPDVDRDTIFDNALEAAEYRNILRGVCQIHDPSVPQTMKQMKGCVKLLFKAFKSTHKAMDHEPMKRPFREQRHDNRMVECLCWSILHAIIARSKSEYPLVHGYDRSKAKNNDKIANFADRFDATLDALAKSKTICKHLFDAPYIEVLVDDPIRACRRVETNRILNKSKADIMKAGKQVKQEHGQDSEPCTTAKKRTLDNGNPDIRDSDGRDTLCFGTPPSRPGEYFAHKRIKSSASDDVKPFPDLGRNIVSFSPLTQMISDLGVESPPLPAFYESGGHAINQPIFTSPYTNRAPVFAPSPLRGLYAGGTGLGNPGPPAFANNLIQRFSSHSNAHLHSPFPPPPYEFPGFSQFTALSPELQDISEQDLQDLQPPSNSDFSS